ncbi:hypothetical protein ACJX0J_019539, partial [Zea mays]
MTIVLSRGTAILKPNNISIAFIRFIFFPYILHFDCLYGTSSILMQYFLHHLLNTFFCDAGFGPLLGMNIDKLEERVLSMEDLLRIEVGNKKLPIIAQADWINGTVKILTASKRLIG